MSIPTSLLQEILEDQTQLHPQMYFKSSLTALSHAMEDQVLAGTDDAPLVIACFQRERFYRQEAHRYLRIAQKAKQVYVLAAPETEFTNGSGPYETIAFDPDDGLAQEWHLVVIGEQYAICLLCREHPSTPKRGTLQIAHTDQARRFEGIWTFDREVSCLAAQRLLQRITHYRPELKTKIKRVLKQLDPTAANGFHDVDPAPFAGRLVTYLQAGQYRQQKAFRQIATQERKERLINSITAAIRCSLDPDQVLRVAVQELGQAITCDRSILYRCHEQADSAPVQYEYIAPDQKPLLNSTWPLQNNPWFQAVLEKQSWVHAPDVQTDPLAADQDGLRSQMAAVELQSLLMVPVLYQGHLIGIVELHTSTHHPPYTWEDAEITLVEAIATQVGIALIQAQSFADLESLNQQLADLEQARSNLIAITGHELRTPLSTIQVCLESLANEPDMPSELQQVMLSTALSDAERMRKLIQDFLTLSKLESGRTNATIEPLDLQECIELALSRRRTTPNADQCPTVTVTALGDLPMIMADGEWVVDVIAKLLDNAYKFTPAQGKVTIQTTLHPNDMVEVAIADTGRGIAPDRLEAVFERFYQTEGALRRSTGGTGLGLAICRQIIHNLNGEIWAESDGEDQGSTFHFTLPCVVNGGR